MEGGKGGDQLPQQLAAMRKAMFDEGILNDFFDQLESLTEGDVPNFAEDYFTTYYSSSCKQIAEIEQGMEENPMAIEKYGETLNRLKSSSGYLGAKKVMAAARQAEEALKARNVEGAKAFFEELKREHAVVKAKLEPYFDLQKKQGGSEKKGGDGEPFSSKDGEENEEN